MVSSWPFNFLHKKESLDTDFLRSIGRITQTAGYRLMHSEMFLAKHLGPA